MKDNKLIRKTCEKLAREFKVGLDSVLDLWDAESSFAPKSYVYDLVVRDLIESQEVAYE